MILKATLYTDCLARAVAARWGTHSWIDNPVHRPITGSRRVQEARFEEGVLRWAGND